MNLKTKKVLCYDIGLFTEQCARLAKDFGQVWYFTPWADLFPHSNKALIGHDFDGLERILDFWDYVEKADMIFIPDTHCGDIVEFLKRKGFLVAGVGRAEILELDRWKARQIQKELKLPYQPTQKVVGLQALRKLLMTEKNKFVKLNVFRGTLETIKHIDYESSKPLLDHLAYELGPKQDTMTFIVEDEIKGLEPGIDSIVFDGENLSPCVLGYEKKGAGYIGSVIPYNQFPKQLKQISDKFGLVFKTLKTRFFYSAEAIVPDRTHGYLIDLTCRMAAPAVSAIQTELIENFSQVIYGLATGQKVQPIMKYKYVAGVALESDWVDTHWTKISFPPSLRQWIKLRVACKFGKDYYAIPGLASLCTVIALGNSIDEVVDLCKQRCEQVNVYQIVKNLTGLDEIVEDIKAGRKLGITF